MSPAEERRPAPPGPIERFRWWLLALPFLVPAFLWILMSAVEPGVWDSVLDGLRVQNRERYSAVCVLAAICSALLACTRVLGRRR